MNGDGLLDMVVKLNEFGITVAINTGTGFAMQPVTTLWQDEVEVGDVTGDGRLDVVGLRSSPNDLMSVFPSSRTAVTAGRSSTTSTRSSSTPWRSPTSRTTDARTQSCRCAGNRPDSRMLCIPRSRPAEFGSRVPYPSYDIPEPVEAYDMNRDGREDVVTVHGGWYRAGVYSQTPDGTLGAEELFPVPYATHYYTSGLALGRLQRRRRSGHCHRRLQLRARRPATGDSAASSTAPDTA